MVSSPVRGNPEMVSPQPSRTRGGGRGGRSRVCVLFLLATTVTAMVFLLFFRREVVAGRRSSSTILPQRIFSFEAPSGREDISGGITALQQQHQQQQRVVSFDAPDGPSAPGVGHSHDHQEQQQLKQRERRPSCAVSDDPEYSCLVLRPPGSFADEIKVYFSLSAWPPAEGGHDKRQQQLLSVKVVVPRATRQGKGWGGDGGGEARWASLGISPDGKMAGPSEAVVGFAGAVERGDQGVFRYWMDGYSTASVARLPDRHQILTEQAVETTADGSLVVRFKRPLLEAPPTDRDTCAGRPVAADEGQRGGTKTTIAASAAVAADDDDVAEAETEAAVCSAAVDTGIEWLDARDEGIVLLWAYGRGAWPSYHDATGAFVLPRLAPSG